MAWTACDVRPRDPGKSVGPIVIKIGYILGCRFAPRVYNFSKVNMFSPFCDQSLTYHIAGFSYYLVTLISRA